MLIALGVKYLLPRPNRDLQAVFTRWNGAGEVLVVGLLNSVQSCHRPMSLKPWEFGGKRFSCQAAWANAQAAWLILVDFGVDRYENAVLKGRRCPVRKVFGRF